MDLFAELIGELSNVRFASVSDRFIAELEKYNSQTIMKERQSHMEMLIRGMRFLKIKVRKKQKGIGRKKETVTDSKLKIMIRFTPWMLWRKQLIFFQAVPVSSRMHTVPKSSLLMPTYSCYCYHRLLG